MIYHLLEDVSGLLVGASPKVEHEVVAGTAEVLQTFPLKGARGKDAGVVAGCRVTDGAIKGSLRYRVLRGGEVVHTGACASLKRHKLEVGWGGQGLGWRAGAGRAHSGAVRRAAACMLLACLAHASLCPDVMLPPRSAGGDGGQGHRVRRAAAGL